MGEVKLIFCMGEVCGSGWWGGIVENFSLVIITLLNSNYVYNLNFRKPKYCFHLGSSLPLAPYLLLWSNPVPAIKLSW